MKQRITLIMTLSCILVSIFGGSLFSATNVSLTVEPDNATFAIPADFAGLSYGTSAIGDTVQLGTSNKALLLLLRQIGPGVIRFGGNSMDNKGLVPFDSTKYRLLLTFLDTINWKVMMGMPLGTPDTNGAIKIAKYLMTNGEKHLLSFEVGNEPDLFYRNGLRATTYSLADYQKEHTTYFKAVRRVVPNAPFSGPTTAKSEWVAGFAAAMSSEIMLLTQHHYSEGPAGDPSVTIGKLLSPGVKKSIVTKMNEMYTAAKAVNILSRLAECNTVYSGGQAGVSDVFASALWATDYMFAVANAGVVGVNFHGGGTGPYTPIAVSSSGVTQVRPEYYGIMLFKYATQDGQIVKSRLSDTTRNIGSYVVRSKSDTLRVVLINKDTTTAFAVAVQGTGASNSARLIRLQAPSVRSTTGITLGGATIGTDKLWAPTTVETVESASNQYLVSLPKASAAVLNIALGTTSGRAVLPVQKAGVSRNMRMIIPTSPLRPNAGEAFYTVRGERIHDLTKAKRIGQPLIVVSPRR